MHQQHTLREELAFEGVGLHTGLPTRVRLLPQPVGAGLRFRLPGGVTFPAHAEYVVETRRATVLGFGGATVSTVEHLLSAILGMGIDNLLIDVEGTEIPVLDGSSKVFADSIASAGSLAQAVPRISFPVDVPHFWADGESLLIVLPAPEFRVRVAVDYAPPIGAQYFAGAIESERYRREVAPARTFGFLHEVEALIASGLARGGSLDNALVFGPEGPLGPLRLANEVVAHKVLDLVGDFALLGAYPRCEVVAHKSGHKLHAQATQELRAGARALQAAAP